MSHLGRIATGRVVQHQHFAHHPPPSIPRKLGNIMHSGGLMPRWGESTRKAAAPQRAFVTRKDWLSRNGNPGERLDPAVPKKIRGIREPFAEGLRLPYVRDGDVEQQR